MKEIYFDNSATTPLCQEARESMISAMEIYGNPSSLHPLGQTAKKLLEDSRKEIEKSLGVRSGDGQVVFTSCGTEGDRLAIIGCAYAKSRRKGGTVISTDSEHPAVEMALQELEADGFRVVRIPTRGGVLDFDAYEKALDNRVFLVTMMYVNNETGAKYDLEKAFRMAKEQNPDTVTHCDAVQAYLKFPFTPKSIHADLVTLSAHKVHGPKGVGALYLSKDAVRRKDLIPTQPGGGQESGMRSGTENLIGIAGFAAAVREESANLAENARKLEELRDYAAEKLSPLPVKLNLPSGDRAPHILHLTLPEIKSETMLHALSVRGICVSAGSACSAHSGKVSSAVLAFGVSRDDAVSSIRLSFNVYNTKEEIDLLATSLQEEIGRLVKIHR